MISSYRFYKSAQLITIILLLMFLVVISGCTREHPSDKPPIHLNPNMDDQPKYKAQAESKFFEDDATMRTPVSGTVAQGELRDDDIYYKGKNIDGSYVLKAPLSINKETLLRGQERFDIYCSPCHSRLGDGRGIMLEKGYVPPPTFHSDRLRNMPDGEIFEVISNGVRNMPSYRHQINVHDRWTIVHYMRALQRSQNASINDIPVELRETVK